MSGMVILTLLELTGYALQDIIDAKNSGDAVVYSSLIGNSIKRYGNTRDIDLSVLVDKITPEVKAAISKKLTNALQKKQKVLQADVEADLAKFFSEESNDEDFSDLCTDLIIGLRSYSDDKSGYLEGEDKERGELRGLGVF